MNTTVIIPNWNGRELLEKNLPKVLEAKSNPNNNIKEVIVVDDGSSDDSVSLLINKYSKKIKLIQNAQNKGFAASINLAVQNAKTDLVCLLNSDVIPSKNFLVSVLPHFKNKKVFGVTLYEKGYGPAIGYFKDGYIQHKGGLESKKVQNTLWVNGGSGVFSKKHWDKLNGFDESLFAPFYWEDVDLGYRAHKRGLVLLWEPTSHVLHRHESTINQSNFKKRYMARIKERGHLLFVWKNITSKTLIAQHRNELIKRVLSHPGYLIIILMALLKIKPVIIRRRIESQESVLSDEQVLSKFN